MQPLIFATNNRNKVEEIKSVIKGSFQVLPLSEAGIDIDIPEPHFTLEENAREKAITIYKMTGSACFAEDTGLEVEALDGEPGVRSARFAGDNAKSEDNIALLLKKLGTNPNRDAQFRTVIHLIINDEEHIFEGICKGRITTEPHGNHGFGYDAVFIPEGAGKTFGEMLMEEKNIYSHRKKAVEKLVDFLNSINENQN